MKYSGELEKEYKSIFANDIHMIGMLRNGNPHQIDRALFELSYSGVSNEEVLKAKSLGKLKEKVHRVVKIMELRTKLWDEFKNSIK